MIKTGLIVYELMNSSNELKQATSGQINAVLIPEGYKNNFVIVKREKGHGNYNGLLHIDDDGLLTVACYSEDYKSSCELGQLVRDVLDCFNGRMLGVDVESIYMVDTFDNAEAINDVIYHQCVLIFKVQTSA